MALYFKSDNNDSSLKTATSVSWAGVGRRRYTHFIAIDTTSNTTFNPQYFWVNGNWDTNNSHTIRCNYDSASETSLRVKGAVFSEAVAINSSITGYRRAILAVSGTGKDDGSNASGYYARMLTIDSSNVINLAKSSWVSEITGGANDLKPSPLVIGDIFSQNNTRNVRDTSFYYVGSADRFLSDDEIIGMGLGEIQPLDYFGDDLVELWDFQQDSDRALTGLIQGTQLVPKGTKYEWTTDAPLPVSRNTFIGIGQPRILSAPAWLSTLDSPAAGSETINCTAADLALSGHGAGLVELSVIECSAGAVSVGGELCAVYQAQAVSCSAAALTLTAAAAQQLEAGDSVISCSTAALALSAAAAQQLEAGDSVVGCTAAALTLSAAAAQQVEVGDSVIGCVAAALTLTTPSAQQLESGDSVISCATASLTLTAAVAQQIEVGDNAISCSTASLTLTTTTAQQLEVGDSVIGCAATIVSLDGTTATITDSMGARSAAVVLSTPGCSIHDFDIIGAGQAALVTGSSAAALVESGEAIIDTGYADIGIAAAQCGIVQTDAEPIVTDIGLVASINQPTIYATIPRRTITARV